MRAYRVAYDGRPFHGFQRQPSVPTVEDALLDALRALDVLDGGVPSGWAAAGRTDAGVSAIAQTVAFEAPAWLTPRAFDAELPESVRVWARADVPPGFHATHDARERSYRYALYAPDADDDRARAACDALSGTHDFHNLTPDDSGTVRVLSLSCRRDGPVLVLTARAGGFARELVRRLVTVVRGVGTGDVDLSAVDRLLGPDPVDGPEGVAPAPPTPLLLREVTYDVTFEVDPAAAARARAAFADRRAEHVALERTFGAAADALDGAGPEG
ncbi:MAG: tRNA pseudouridine(38-40) synthase TruA [Halobacteriaceae archaeon]